MSTGEWWMEHEDGDKQLTGEWSIHKHLEHWQLESADENEIVFNNNFWSQWHKDFVPTRRRFYRKDKDAE